MKRFCIFLDESGMSNPKMYKSSPYYSVCGIVINEEVRTKIKSDFDQLKLKYFKKNIVLHSSELRKIFRTPEKMDAFAQDLDKLLRKFPFFLLYVVVDNQKASKYSWTSTSVNKKAYRTIIGNLIKFLIAKNASGKIYSEASNVSQDITLYQNFFHYLANGIPDLSISPKDVKGHLTAVNFVTKANNDIEEQIADLFGCIGRLKIEVDNDIKKETDLDSLEKVLLKIANKYIFGLSGTKATKIDKVKLYKSINSFLIIHYKQKTG